MLIFKIGLLKEEVGKDIRPDTRVLIGTAGSALGVSYHFLDLGI